MQTKEITDVINASLRTVRIPSSTDRVYKEECMYSFDNPETDTGLYVSLATFWGVGHDFVEEYSKRIGNNLFLHCHRIKRKIIKNRTSEGPEKKITRLAIGVEGGFDGNDTHDYDVEEIYQLAIFPGFHTFSLESDIIPKPVLLSIEGIKSAESASKLAELEALAGTWDGEIRKVSKYAYSLTQFDNGKKVPSRGWRCEVPGCTFTENLWLNLTDGSILCGRRYANGSGGNNHALDHYSQCQFPLAVKLGTITPDGHGDVYSYEEDDMVEDPNLVKHLAHFGINVADLEKTDKSMIEMEIELNQRQSEWNAIQETGKKLKPLYGPGFTGMINLGNSCYLNSVIQLLFSIPNFQHTYSAYYVWRLKEGDGHKNNYGITLLQCYRFDDTKYFQSSSAGDPTNDLKTQMTKLCIGLNSGKYSRRKDLEEEDEEEQIGINPLSFRSLVGKGHREFATKKQQDAQEFFLHLVNLLERNCRSANPAEIFKFEVEDKVVCDVTGMVKFTYRTESCLPLPIPFSAASNLDEVAAYEAAKAEQEASGNRSSQLDLVRPKLPLEACLSAFYSPAQIEFYSSGALRNCTGTKFTRLATFPDYLVIQLQKFTAGADGVAKKLDVSVDMPFDLDITQLRGQGLQANEVLLPDDAKPVPVLDEGVVNQLIEMGFQPNGARRAVISSGNAGSEAAMNWIMIHLDDPCLNDPLSSAVGSNTYVPNEAAIENICVMGFTRDQANRALKATDNNVERAIDWIFSHQDELDMPEELPVTDSAVSHIPKCKDGPGRYSLQGFISHMGSSTMCGHYVAHIRKNGQWVIFNDSKVAESENLPKDLGYLYFYRRLPSS